MSTTKKKAPASPEAAPSGTGEGTHTAPFKPRNIAAYEAAVEQFATASKLFLDGKFDDARPHFEAVTAAATPDEPILADRARTYAAICDRKRVAPTASADDADSLYHHGVVAANAGRLDEAWALLERTAGRRANDASIHYARASVRGLQGDAERASAELKKAIAIDPKFRFQAVSDSDFDKVRDEASFIDIIEPSAAGA